MTTHIEYDTYHLHEHITTPRRSWREAGKPLRRALPHDWESRINHPQPKRKKPKKYIGVYRDGNKWCWRFRHNGVTHRKTAYATEDDAAAAHDDYVKQHGIARALLLGGAE